MSRNPTDERFAPQSGGERELIARLTRDLEPHAAHVLIGIGDDCAVSTSCGDERRLCTTDLLVEGVHFDRRTIEPEQLGAKSLAVNLSDIAAMGGRALDAFVSLAIPHDVGLHYLERLYAGLGEMARHHDVQVIGGDTTASRGPLVINIAVIGAADEASLLRRSGARPGDALYVSGPLGDAAAGLLVLQAQNTSSPGQGDAAALVRAHQAPSPRLALGQELAEKGRAHAAIDLSDGLSTDLAHVCRASGVGARIERAALPLSSALLGWSLQTGADPVALALHGGEDYELLVAGAEALGDAFPGRLWRIGEVVAGEQITLVGEDGCGSDGEAAGSGQPLDASGWDPFRG